MCNACLKACNAHFLTPACVWYKISGIFYRFIQTAAHGTY
ncbi:hypothetical protein HMPREF9370_1558 [Neisseria wadsworthii 9715]|uniref:Uncharacterized protein n=1 Tax=Neisseria wadsworthii 9715 TaxID=1030841 RepID=G4CR48_9NEIS|nr:hypothetical protein HMPREF9370_1558 [Neisseria wadsworthii 9715]